MLMETQLLTAFSGKKNISTQRAPQNCHLQDLPHTAYHMHHCQGTWTDFSFYSVLHIWIISQLWLDIRCLKPSRRTPYLQRGHARCMEASQAGRHGECQTQVRFAPFALVLVLHLPLPLFDYSQSCWVLSRCGIVNFRKSAKAHAVGMRDLDYFLQWCTHPLSESDHQASWHHDLKFFDILHQFSHY